MFQQPGHRGGKETNGGEVWPHHEESRGSHHWSVSPLPSLSVRSNNSVPVTSLTDFLAFAIGGTTVLPALRSFCIFCAVGLIVVYLLQATWFVSWFSLDQRRIEEKRNGSVPCIKHKHFKPNNFSQRNILQSVFKSISNVIVKKPIKVVILVVTSVLLGISVWGNILLKQEFNPIWFLPSESYLAQWHKYNSQYFPSQGRDWELDLILLLS